MLLIMISDQYPNNYKALKIYTEYFDSLDNMILLSYPTSIVITREYCTVMFANHQIRHQATSKWAVNLMIVRGHFNLCVCVGIHGLTTLASAPLRVAKRIESLNP